VKKYYAPVVLEEIQN